MNHARHSHDKHVDLATTPPAPTVRAAEARDLPHLARLHSELLPHGFFVQLGPDFLQRWHRAFVDSQHGAALIAVDSGLICGFLLGTTDQAGHTSDVVRLQRRALAAAGIRALVVRPRLAARFLRTRASRYLRRLQSRRRAEAVTTDAPHVAVVHAVATVPSCRGRGVGRQLLAVFEEQSRAAGAPRMQLVTQDGDAGASTFYYRLGWTRMGSRPGKDDEIVVLFQKPVVTSTSNEEVA